MKCQQVMAIFHDTCRTKTELA